MWPTSAWIWQCRTWRLRRLPDPATRGSAFLLANLAAGFQARHRRRHSREDLEAGVDAYQQACQEALTYDLEVALNAALDWGDWASTRAGWAEASGAYALAFQAAAGLWQHQAGRTGKEIWLRAARRLGERPAWPPQEPGSSDVRRSLLRGDVHGCSPSISALPSSIWPG